MQKDDRLIYLMARAQHRLRAFMKKKFSDQGLNITPVQTGILFLLQKDALTMTELSQVLSIDNSAVTGLVDRLEKAGLAERQMNANDRRAFLVRITDQGTKEINRAHKIVKHVNEKIKDGFTDKEVETFKKVLDSFFEKFRKE